MHRNEGRNPAPKEKETKNKKAGNTSRFFLPPT